MPNALVRTIAFPTVTLATVAISQVSVEPFPSELGSDKFAVSPRFPWMNDLLLDWRAAEGNDLRRGARVQITFGQTSYLGRSYGLATAIADKRARHPKAPDTPVIATGCIVAGGGGEIGDVETFVDKACAVISNDAYRGEDFTFAFPAANWRALDESLRERLEAEAKAKGITLLACDTIEDASRLWQVPGKGRLVSRIAACAIVAVLLLVAAGLGFHVLAGRDVRACKALVAQLPETNQPPASLGVAITTCQDAVAAHPTDGSVETLLGNLRAADNNPELAGVAWKRAAELGDRDGMTAYGEFLSQAPFENRPDAMMWLKKAAASGSAVAADDIAYMLDHQSRRAEADRWRQAARQIRDDAQKGK